MGATVKIGTVGFSGQKSGGGGYIRMGGDVTIVRETPAYWIDNTGWWWRKRDLKHEPQGNGPRFFVPLAPSSAPPSPCPRCHGSGSLTEDPLPGCPAGPSVYEHRECPACEGTGENDIGQVKST